MLSKACHFLLLQAGIWRCCLYISQIEFYILPRAGKSLTEAAETAENVKDPAGMGVSDVLTRCIYTFKSMDEFYEC